MAGIPYLGSKIWLVSKSEIKYEGILYTIDTKESTVTLAKVRCFGTEDRPTDRPVAPTDEVYEYIIFRASDVKDLNVCESAKQQALLPSGLANDPAIVQHSAPLPPPAVTYGQTQNFGHMYGMPLSHYPGPLNNPHVLPTLFSGTGSRSGASSQTSLKSATTDAGVQVSTGDQEETGSRGSLSYGPRRPNLRDSQLDRNSSQNRLVNQNRGPQRGRGGRRGRGRGRGGGSFLMDFETLKFDGEYDFEQANEEFKLLETKLAGIKLVNKSGEGDAPAPEADVEDDSSYDRQKSFFDNISCEASRVAKGIPRFDWRVERKLNIETFGIAVSNSWFRRRRGRGGYRQRGGFQRGRMTPQPMSDSLKTVTFGPNEVVTVEAATLEEPIEIPKEEIPVIQIVEEKEKDWKEGDSKEEWDVEATAVQ